ncbi:indolepyruvate oxidoreductase subunit beta family protein [Parapusillimonas granuli]|uniref:Indolepyruvate oxidoreductase subunit beta family protein n=1 Tax=Parapusillimonas granuli TaxID=380911 RepID=A0A853FUS2_9BURK|nr:indolepyruvate oxidoreductase subunit beta family protein [Parapusillimonas granuli]MBB5216212.1 indolepyruvate ferredoxin oxidoreductase beta subunit [Parapusillimonas granuli]MEB2400487.1 indolepyruvate oxidoreductase subunit beta family protein [Alcaligenaceae bacterium]NYT47889.1 indolepyruvate oxidoreductase subunit beta family protein [Parapusillimonas granuli]
MTSTAFSAGTPIKIAILAMGGQGGGVLADWIVDMAEHAGWWAQTTSVPGVAQRTGATIYYLEMIPEAAVAEAGRAPVLAMMPTPGDVDVVVAAELMEGGRAIQRGLVTPDRTLLIASSHRSYAIAEKAAHGNGIADPNTVISAGRQAARKFYCFDLQALADQAGSVISASLFGALAGSGALPFPRDAYEATISRGGVGVEASLRAFRLGLEAAERAPREPALLDLARPQAEIPAASGNPRTRALLDELRGFPAEAQPMLMAGLQRVLEFQDAAYAEEYLAHMRDIRNLDGQFGGPARHWALTTAAARYVAVAMAYDDVIRVADLKTRQSREERVRTETGVANGQILHTTEYMHPRLEEICGTLPASWGRAIEGSPRLVRALQPLFRKGRFVRSSGLTGFLLLYGLAGMRRFRRRTLRHQHERASLAQWLKLISDTVHHDYDLAVEVVNIRRLVKGYSDTHQRGTSKYQRLSLAASQLLGRADAAEQLRALRDAALADDHGSRLDRMLDGLLGRPGPINTEPRDAS